MCQADCGAEESPGIEESSAIRQVRANHDQRLYTEKCWSTHERRVAESLHATDHCEGLAEKHVVQNVKVARTVAFTPLLRILHGALDPLPSAAIVHTHLHASR